MVENNNTTQNQNEATTNSASTVQRVTLKDIEEQKADELVDKFMQEIFRISKK